MDGRSPLAGMYSVRVRVRVCVCVCQALVVLRLLPVLLYNTAGRDKQQPGLDYTPGRSKSLSSVSLTGSGFSEHVCA